MRHVAKGNPRLESVKKLSLIHFALFAILAFCLSSNLLAQSPNSSEKAEEELRKARTTNESEFERVNPLEDNRLRMLLRAMSGEDNLKKFTEENARRVFTERFGAHEKGIKDRLPRENYQIPEEIKVRDYFPNAREEYLNKPLRDFLRTVTPRRGVSRNKAFRRA